jgi:hypothetical protein
MASPRPSVVVAVQPRLLGEALVHLLTGNELDVEVLPDAMAREAHARVLVTNGDEPIDLRADVVVRFAGDLDDVLRTVIEATRAQ